MTGRVLLVAVACLITASAAAQDADPALRAHRFTLIGGASWVGGYPIGANTATLRGNQPGTLTPTGIPLFHADASFERAIGTEGRLGFALRRTLAVEVGGAYVQPNILVDITQDPESAPLTIRDEHVSQFTIDVSVNWQLPRVRLGSRARPYVVGGGGYLRQLYEERVKVETGRIAYVGGGVRYWLRGGDTSHRALGIRGEARVQTRRGGIDYAGQSRTSPVFTLLVFWGL